MKSITVTPHRSINYGAVLQSYALQQKQIELGIDNKILEVPKSIHIYENMHCPSLRTFIINFISNIFIFFHRKIAYKQLEVFDDFVTNKLNLTECFVSVDEVEKKIPRVDFIITGSDQVFGLRGASDKLRMLDFNTNGIKKFSYAASLGEYDWSSEEEKKAEVILKKYSGISVREKYAQDYLKKNCNINCRINIDPVFLIDRDRWIKFAKAPSYKEQYILCYHIISNKNTQIVLDLLKKKYNVKIVCLQTSFVKRIHADKFVFSATPEEFLGWINNAIGVVTTSFHGTAFSAILKKPFYTLVKDYKSQRMTDLLEVLKLNDRVIKDNDEVSSVNLDVNFDECEKSILNEQIKSMEYFHDILNSCKDNL